MNIKFIPMNIGGKEQVASAISRLEAVLSVYGCGESAVCTESSMLVSELSAAFSTAEMVIVGVEPNRYCKTKQALMHAMHVKMQLNVEVSERISAFKSASGEALAEQCSLPAAAEVFLTADGLCCGFAIKSGKQHFVMLPLLNGQLDGLIANGLLPYFDKVGIKPHEKADDEPTVVNTVEDIDVPDEEDEDETISEALLDWVRKSNNALQGSGLKTYFAKTPSSEMFMDLCDSDENSPFVFTDYFVERGSIAPKDYIADLARDAIAETDSGIGAAVSNVFTSAANAEGEKKYNIYIAVADASTARVLRLVSEPGETPEQLVYAAAEKLFEMLFDKCVMGIASSDEIGYLPTQDEVERLNAAGKKKKRKRAIRILIYCLLAIIITIFIYFTVDGVRAANNEKDAAEATFATYAAAIETYGADNAVGSENGEFEIIVNEDDWFSTPSDEGVEALDEVTTSVDTAEVATVTAEVKATTVKAVKKTTTTEIISSLKSTSTNAATKTTKAPATTKKPSSAASTVKKTTTASTTKKTTATTTKHNSILDYFSTVATTAITSIVPTSTAVSTPSSGSFVITTYGYGHGVGMSQEGARGYAKQGWSHTQILNHYYPGTSVVKDAESVIPETVTFGSKSYSLCEYLCCTVVAEIGYGTSDTLAALEAQAVAAYTYAKRSGFSVSSANHAFKAGWAYGGSLVETAVNAVIGEYVSYNGSPANTFYFAMSAGKTTDVSTVWSGGSNYPYLKGGVASEPDKSCAKYKVVTTFTAEEMKTLMKNNLGVELTGDPAKWFTIVSHDSAVNSKIGYVTKMTVGGKSLKGSTFRNTGMQLKIRSHCFTIEYVK